MKTKQSINVISMLFFALVSSVAADVLDFEDLYPGREVYGHIPWRYHGFSWNYDGSGYITKYLSRRSGYEYGTVGRVSLFTREGRDISLSDRVFDFYGAYITSAWYSTEEIDVEGWRGGSLVHKETITTHNDQPYWFDFNFTNIDTLWFKPHADHIVIDNITFEPIESQPPIADAGIDLTVLVHETFELDGSGSYDDDGSIVSWTWDTGESNILSGQTVQHSYASDGVYTVILTVTDSQNLTDTDTLTVTVLTPGDAIANIAGTIEGLGLNSGQTNSLYIKLENAIAAINSENTPSAVNILKAFINEVEALSTLTQDQKEDLTDDTKRIIESIQAGRHNRVSDT